MTLYRMEVCSFGSSFCNWSAPSIATSGRLCEVLSRNDKVKFELRRNARHGFRVISLVCACIQI